MSTILERRDRHLWSALAEDLDEGDMWGAPGRQQEREGRREALAEPRGESGERSICGAAPRAERRFDRAWEQLRELHSLGGEEEIEEEALERAEEILEELQLFDFPAPEIKADPPEAVQFLWSRGTKPRGRFLDIDVAADTLTGSLVELRDGELHACSTEKLDRSSLPESMLDYLDWLGG